jgi:hypothetical protein
VRRLLGPGEACATATIAYAETHSGLTRRQREGGLSARQYDTVCREFERDWPHLVQVKLAGPVLARTRSLIQRHALRGFDAIHLASALLLQLELDEAITLVAADGRLLRAAADEGLVTVDVAS